MFFTVILLAAGESSRMGQPKQLLPWMGTTLLQYQVDQLKQTVAQELIVVLGKDAPTYRRMLPLFRRSASGPRLVVMENKDYELGKTTSVKAGIAAADDRSEAVVPLASDSPRTAAVLDRLMACHAEGKAPITYPWHKGTEGHPGVFSLTLREELMGISETRRGLREVTERDPSRVRREEFEDPLVIVNLNTPQDYERALRLTGQAAAGESPGFQ